MGGGGGGAGSANAKIGDAAERQLKMGEEWLQFSKDQFALSKDRLAEIDSLIQSNSTLMKNLTQEQADFTKTQTERQLGLAEEQLGISRDVSQKQLESAEWQDGIARADRERYETIYRPIEDQFIEEASNYGSEARQDEYAARAMADVQTAAAAGRQAAQREAMSFGINPNSGRFAGINRAGELGTALATAGAANNARTAIQDKGLSLKADIANLGRGVSAQALSTAQGATSTQNSALNALNSGTSLSLNASNNAVAARGTATDGQMSALSADTANRLNSQSAFLASTGIVGQGYSGAAQGLSNASGIWAGQQQRADNNSNALLGAIGTGAGLLLSDEEVKEDKEPIPEGEALEAVRSMPVETWRYKEGVADEGEHVGTYAQDFQEQTGSGDGTTIPIGDAIGITMKAVQDLASKVDAIEGAVGLRPPAKKRSQPPKQAVAATPTQEEPPPPEALPARPSRQKLAEAPGLRPRVAA